jgi:hypothetical protein
MAAVVDPATAAGLQKMQSTLESATESAMPPERGVTTGCEMSGMIETVVETVRRVQTMVIADITITREILAGRETGIEERIGMSLVGCRMVSLAGGIPS